MTKPKKTETRQQRHRLKRRAAGLCGREGCSKVTGERYYCREHASDNLSYKK